MMASQEEQATPDEEEVEDDGPRTREPAWRLFAAEFNDATHETQGPGERAPSYVITPLGGRVNRLLAVGVLTQNEPTGEDGSMRRAQVTDPTGVFHVYAGQYQPEALEALERIEAPSIVAVVGKARTYSPEEGTVYTSIRPETIHEVTSEDRDAWILETAEHTMQRVEALAEAYDLEEPTDAALAEAGVPDRLAPGIVEAIDTYGEVDIPSYLSLVADALGYLLPAPPSPQIVHAGEGEPPDADEPTEDDPPSDPSEAPEPAAEPTAAEQPTQTEEGPQADEEAPSPGSPGVDAEGVVFDLVEELDDGDGAAWEDIVTEGQDAGLTEEEVEEAMNQLMDRGRVFEPVLGKLKPT